MACLSRACSYPAAAGLCHLGPLLHFKKSASGCCQPPPAGGPPTADLSNYTRRAGRRYPAPPGPVGRRAAGPGNLPTARALAAPAGCDTGSPGRAVAAELQPAKRAAGGPKPTPGRRCGPGAACKPVASDWRSHVPARRILPVCFRSTDCAAKHDNCAGALASRSRGKLWPRLRSTNAPWGFLRVRL